MAVMAVTLLYVHVSAATAVKPNSIVNLLQCSSNAV